jgi:hypothetical protein
VSRGAAPETPCGRLIERYYDCGYDTNIPGLPEQQERLLAIEAGSCDEELTCYAGCMLAVDADEDECWGCEFRDMECLESPASECPGLCESSD